MKQVILVALILPDETDIDIVKDFVEDSGFDLYSEIRIMELHPYTMPVSGKTRYETANPRVLVPDKDGNLQLAQAGQTELGQGL